ncbi:MAG: ammonium transporter [Candidatus Hydrogenedentales bacterium]|jgi:Amt family ammonium transporter
MLNVESKHGPRRRVLLSALAAVFLGATCAAYAQTSLEDLSATTANLKVMADTVWVLVTAFLVFWMNAGFALVESGFCRKKNTVNILTKNFIVFAISALSYWVVGFALMYGDGNPYIGLNGWLLSGADNSPATGDAYEGVFAALNWTGVPLFAKFFFQLVFAGTAATIVSGAVAERIKIQSFMFFSVLLVAIIYPIAGHWIWGGGWLAAKGFHDFAGSTQVHSIGGWAALMGIIFLGPRIGKYRPDGSINAIPGHNMTSAALGGLILWLGWFGFNPGSTMAVDPGAIALVTVTTCMAAAAGTVASCFYSWVRIGKPDMSMIINGCLAGLVAITAPCDGVTVMGSVIIGLIAGVLVVEAVMFFDKIKIDDPVGALSVHLVNGIWGTLAYGLFNTTTNEAAGWTPGLFYGGGVTQLVNQATGVGAVAVFTIVSATILWGITKLVLGLRVTPDEEYVGLDQSEMGLEAYPDDAQSPAYRVAAEA